MIWQAGDKRLRLLLDVLSLGRTLSWSSLQRVASAPFSRKLSTYSAASHLAQSLDRSPLLGYADNFWQVDTRRSATSAISTAMVTETAAATPATTSIPGSHYRSDSNSSISVDWVRRDLVLAYRCQIMHVETWYVSLSS